MATKKTLSVKARVRQEEPAKESGPIRATEEKDIDRPKPVVPEATLILVRKGNLLETLQRAMNILGSSHPIAARPLIEEASEEIRKAHMSWKE